MKIHYCNIPEAPFAMKNREKDEDFNTDTNFDSDVDADAYCKNNQRDKKY